MKKLILGLAGVVGLAAFSIGFAGRETNASAATFPLRADMACSPLTSSQTADVGDSQTCRIRLRNTTASPITDVTYVRPTPNTLTARYPYKASYGISCDLSGCDPFTLAPGSSVIIFEISTFGPYQDGRGKTTVTATGTLNGATVTASGMEQNSLP